MTHTLATATTKVKNLEEKKKEAEAIKKHVITYGQERKKNIKIFKIIISHTNKTKKHLQKTKKQKKKKRKKNFDTKYIKGLNCCPAYIKKRVFIKTQSKKMQNININRNRNRIQKDYI